MNRCNRRETAIGTTKRRVQAYQIPMTPSTCYRCKRLGLWQALNPPTPRIAALQVMSRGVV